MNENLDIYCERLTVGLWAEPLNALTNVAFFVAAFFAYIHTRKYRALDWRSGTLIFMLVLIGIGSAAFHTFATRITMMMDVIPILFYQISFITFYARYAIKLPWVKTAGLFGLFMVSSLVSDQIPADYMNGSLSYAPALIFLLGFAFWHYKNAAHEKYILFIAAGMFSLSLTFRSIDMELCAIIPIGTHFLWHCLNGVVLYLTTRGFIRLAR